MVSFSDQQEFKIEKFIKFFIWFKQAFLYGAYPAYGYGYGLGLNYGYGCGLASYGYGLGGRYFY